MSQAVSLRAEPFKCICGINGLGPAQQAKRQLRPLLTGIDIESEKYNQNATSKLQLGDPFATLPTKSLNGCLYCIWRGKGSGGWLSNLERLPEDKGVLPSQGFLPSAAASQHHLGYSCPGFSWMAALWLWPSASGQPRPAVARL